MRRSSNDRRRQCLILYAGAVSIELVGGKSLGAPRCLERFLKLPKASESS